jgi:cysteinyl-tRNA synthetase
MKVYNTLSGKKEEFIPQGDEVKMYVCGVTPYDDSHIGHAMSYIIFDVIRRYLRSQGYKVKYVQNVTDIDDKIIDRANKRGVSTHELVKQYTDSFDKDMKDLNIIKAETDKYPKATEEIPKIIEVIGGLIDKGYAYPAGGSVYFRVRKDPDYGKLSHRSLESMRAAEGAMGSEEKEDPMDFALWKAAKPGEPWWESPWGKGRPGWHIECSAMSLKYLGDTLDIHGGGQDLVFPHHENEIAQSEGFTGKKPFVKYWLHNGLVQLGEEKMSKSLGNLITIKQALEKYSSDAIRIFILSSHYRSPLTYSEEALGAAESGAERLTQAISRQDPTGGKGKALDAEPYREQFIEAMDDDFNTPQAVAVLFDLARDINRFGDEGYSVIHGQQLLAELSGVLGLTLRTQKIVLDTDTDKERKQLVERRDAERQAKQWSKADEIRKELAKLGIAIKDTPRGSLWNPKGMHLFNVATNLCQRFVIGYEAENDNFYLKGETLGNRPVLSCRIFDSRGKFLYGLERNNLTPASSRYRFMLTKEGWHKVVDDKGNELLRIESRVAGDDNIITYIFGTFFDKNRELAAEGTGRGLLVNCPLRMG